MTKITQKLSTIERGDTQAAARLLPLVYDELRKLAAATLAREKPGQTLQATALVHEAYLRLVDSGKAPHWNGRGHFFAAAAEAMRRILVENARRRLRIRHGGGARPEQLHDPPQIAGPEPSTVLAIDEAVAQLAASDPEAAHIVNLHVFAGFTLEETADSLGISRATVYRLWAYARATLRLVLRDFDRDSKSRLKATRH